MKAWKVALVALSVALAGCNDDDNDNSTPPPPPEPPVETSVPADEATSMAVTVTAVDATTGAISFTLATADAKPIAKLVNISVQYMGYPAADWQAPRSESNFKLRWHQSHQISCDLDGCDGALVEVQPGSYTFTPDQYDWNNDVANYKYSMALAGALAQTSVDLTAIATQ
ncbi:hypothetical protein [uncultured Ferrimonas sp.]|uniref:hypothetical protein n=1 Tax=uncultured Ferrimonas sp. TaxID=432640 RepID=UPI002639C9F1|nr:hypothetical protein [uncultured Ferrimonas sp.]